ncbi:hypothetical protein V8C26DRAFT_266029 [Trichoderma gracile]
MLEEASQPQLHIPWPWSSARATAAVLCKSKDKKPWPLTGHGWHRTRQSSWSSMASFSNCSAVETNSADFGRYRVGKKDLTRFYPIRSIFRVPVKTRPKVRRHGSPSSSLEKLENWVGEVEWRLAAQCMRPAMTSESNPFMKTYWPSKAHPKPLQGHIKAIQSPSRAIPAVGPRDPGLAAQCAKSDIRSSARVAGKRPVLMLF